ncbi:glutaredoxin family protein [Methanobrevibacter curvatus]|uniref:Regulatory protein Spx n=1 Tax=Methanobrevibacter curvatus TaxID=49547 RepID=A0A166CIL8_9EURY|nr:glutaredoxin family protein [Methanobrevibacter curvatus]KZX14677.1 regulatory protein Spx [Methanobrevibacter curvatus]
MNLDHVNGSDKGNVVLFALSTCQWCRKTRALLDELDVAYDFTYVDLTSGEERDEVVKELTKWNPQLSFPTIVINNTKVITGFKEDEIRETFS